MKLIHKKLVILLFFTLYLGQAALDESIIRLVDRNAKSYVFRGNLPIDQKTNKFQFQELRQTLQNKTDTKTNRLIIISLLNFFTAKQTKNRYIEENFYKGKHAVINSNNRYDPSYITMLKNFPILGSFINPASVPEGLRQWMSNHYDLTTFDDVNGIIDTINKHIQSPIATIIYFHCSAGMDRVGLVAAAYKMRNYNATFADVYRENLEIIKGKRKHMHFHAFYALQWYCLSLGKSNQECMVEKGQVPLEEL